MQTRRKLSELLQIMLDNPLDLDYGLCLNISNLYQKNLITCLEFKKLRKYIDNNRPSVFSSFDAFYCKVIIASNWYWTKGNIKPRIEWLNKHIKKQKQVEKRITSFTISYK